MKKIISLMLAVLMLAMPVMGASAESFSRKYLEEGQRAVVDVSIDPGIALLASVPENFQAAVQDLLSVLTIQFSGQSSDGGVQGALRLLLDGETAADAILALGDKGAYVASTFLGDKVYQITPEQLIQTYAQQAVSGGDLTQEQLDSFQNAMADPEAAMAAMFEGADPTALMAALAGLVNLDTEPEEVKEIPEGVTIAAKYVMTIPVKKDALKNVTQELAKFLWSMPIVQQIAPNTKINDSELTEESLTAALNSIPDALAEDAEVKVYLTEDGASFQVISTVKMGIQDRVVPMEFNLLSEGGETTHILWQFTMDVDEQNGMYEAGDMYITASENASVTSYTVTMLLRQDGVEYAPMTVSYAGTQTLEETVRSWDGDIHMQMITAPGEDPVDINVTVANTAQDLGDHAEVAATIRMAMENVGDVATIHVNARTDIAEAYIITEDTVQPAAMTQEELQTLAQEMTGNYVAGLMALLGRLPASVLNLFMNTWNGN